MTNHRWNILPADKISNKLLLSLNNNGGTFWVCSRCGSVKDPGGWLKVRKCNDVLTDFVMKE